jgi:hypothetical protein
MRYAVKEGESPDRNVEAFGILALKDAVYLICQTGLTVARQSRHSVTVDDQGFVRSHRQIGNDVAGLEHFH